MSEVKAVAFSSPSSQSFPYSVKQSSAVTSQMQREHWIVIKTQNFTPHKRLPQQHSPDRDFYTSIATTGRRSANPLLLNCMYEFYFHLCE